MSLIFTSSNFITSVNVEASVKQHVCKYTQNEQKIKIENANKIVVHLWGGGGGGGGGRTNDPNKKMFGAGGGGSFTILDFPYYPTRKEILVEVIVGKGGSGGFFTGTRYNEAQNGGNTIVYFKDMKGRILKEFISYGGNGGQGNGSITDSLKKGGDGGRNTLVQDYILMGAVYEQNALQSFPKGGNINRSTTGDHCQMNYLSVSGSGGGSNLTTEGPNHGGSFILNKGGMGGNKGEEVAGGGGSTYYGKGGNGGTITNPIGGDGEMDSGAGGGGSIAICTDSTKPISVRGGNGAHGMAIIEVYT
jgi:hypothetical protein